MSAAVIKTLVTLLLWIVASNGDQHPIKDVFQPNKRSELVPTMDFSSDPLLRKKRLEIDLQTCIDNFNVHRDKIIRTQDSQNMGAKYLNEIDLGSRVECLKLCCETEDCDVFVFEEKNSGSCYLFHCGPPEDFKCKFTHHVNYSSAVLSINRHLPDLESEIKLTKHVQDLTKLRKPELLETADMVRLIPDVPETIKPTTTLSPAITREVIPNDGKQFEARKCRRDQFECRSNGECIAIYNACNGIPQCADGSDEAPVLDCPAAVDAVVNTISQTTAPPPTRKAIQSAPVHDNPQSVLQYGREGELVQQQRPQPPVNYQSLYHPQPKVPSVQSNADFLRPIPDPRSPSRAQFEPVVQIPNYIGFPGNNWGQQPIGQQSIQQMQQYQDVGNQVFSHKEKTFHNDGQISQIPYPEYSGRVPAYYGENNYRQPIQQESWPPEQARYSQQQQPMYQPQFNQAPVLPAKTEGTSHVEEPVLEPSAKVTEAAVNPTHVQEKLAHDLKHSKDSMEHGPNQKVTIKTALVSQVEYAEPYKMADESREDLSHVPRGAILSLTLGLILTGVMAILIGCRLKVVRRRLRKGEKYAHNADYLVNGMYL